MVKIVFFYKKNKKYKVDVLIAKKRKRKKTKDTRTCRINKCGQTKNKTPLIHLNTSLQFKLNIQLNINNKKLVVISNSQQFKIVFQVCSR